MPKNTKPRHSPAYMIDDRFDGGKKLLPPLCSAIVNANRVANRYYVTDPRSDEGKHLWSILKECTTRAQRLFEAYQAKARDVLSHSELTSLDARLGEWVRSLCVRNDGVRPTQSDLIPDFLRFEERMTAKPGQGQHPVDNATLAMVYLLQEPEITPTELAERVGVSRGTLYSKSPKWKGVRRTLIASKSARPPKGYKTADGQIEAIDDGDGK